MWPIPQRSKFTQHLPRIILFILLLWLARLLLFRPRISRQKPLRKLISARQSQYSSHRWPLPSLFSRNYPGRKYTTDHSTQELVSQFDTTQSEPVDESAKAAIVYILPSLQTNTSRKESLFFSHLTPNDLYTSIRHLFHYFNNDANYPVHVFLEDYSEQIKNDLLLEFTFPSAIDGLSKVKHLESIRFHKLSFPPPPSGVFPIYPQEHPHRTELENFYFKELIQLAELEDVEYIWHLRPTIKLEARLEYDPFEVMKVMNVKYAYRSLPPPVSRDVSIQLWNTLSQMLHESTPSLSSILHQDYSTFWKEHVVQNEFKIPHPREWMSADIPAFDVGFEFMHVPTFKNVLKDFNHLISEKRGIYEFSWRASALRYASVQYHLIKETDISRFCDIAYTDSMNSVAATCLTPIEYKAASPEYLQKTMQSVSQTEKNVEFMESDSNASFSWFSNPEENRQESPQEPQDTKKPMTETPKKRKSRKEYLDQRRSKAKL